ncbi:hypothetical protein QTO34_016508 [Cnephaeus nilssonii]|uniref:Lsm14-like N-terminal domain-containing protein n=1 Tax=Cnephaeus nilssonii TaxID=3371016 RepID=A0AA40LS84_CNENI|nr:hypothetical protein QTO34_016508 [Eptesicus nilssonii]
MALHPQGNIAQVAFEQKSWILLMICKISLISKAEICHEGILYTIDTENSTVALVKVPLVQKTDQQIIQYHPEMKPLNTFYSVGVILKTSLFVSLQNRNVLCLRTQLPVSLH